MAISKIEVEITAEITNLNKGVEDVERKLSDLGRTLTGIGKILTAGLTVPLTALGVASIKTFGDIEALKKGLIAVMGSSEGAETEFKKLIEVAKLPGLGLEEASRGSVALQSAGFSADEARASLLAFGNALATVGKGKNELNFVILALTQLQNKTSGFGQDLRQLTEQLPQLRGALTAAFGTADSQAIAELGVTGKEVVQLITAEFAKLPKVTGGIKNAFENFSDSTKLSFARVGESINKAFDVEGTIDKVSNFIGSLSKKFTGLDSSTQKIILVFAGLAAGIGPLLLGIGGIISALPLLIAGFAALTGPIGLAVIAVTALSAGIVYLVANTGLSEAAIAKQETALGTFKLAIDKAAEAQKILNDFNNSSIIKSPELIKATQDLIKARIEDARATLLQAQAQNILAVEEAKKESLFDIIVGFERVQRRVNKVQGEGVEKTRELNKLLDDLTIQYITLGNESGKVITDLGKGLGLIGGLTAQINALNEQRDLAKDQVEINLISKKIVLLQDQLELINAIANRASEPIKPPVKPLLPRESPFAGGLPSLPISDAPGVQTAPTAQMEAATMAGKQAIDAYYAELKRYADQFSGDLQQIFETGITNTFANLGSSIGEAIATGANVMEAAGKSILRSLGGFLGELGYMMIQYGTMAIVKAKLDASLLVPGAGVVTGPLAIAAGVALVALSSAIGAKASGMSGGGGGSVGSGVSSQSFGGSGVGFDNSSIDLNGEFIVRGTDLVYVISQEEKKRSKG